MSISQSVDVLGATELASTLGAAASKLDSLTQADQDAARRIVTRASLHAPRQTGRLAASIHASKSGDAVEVGSSLIYAPVIHNGWPHHNISADPFLARGFDESVPYVLDVYGRKVGDAIATVRGS